MGYHKDNPDYQDALVRAKRIWTPESQKHTQRLTFEAHKVAKQIASDRHRIPGLEREHGKEVVEQAQQYLKHHRIYDWAEEEEVQTGKKKENAGTSKKHREEHSPVAGEKESQGSAKPPPSFSAPKETPEEA